MRDYAWARTGRFCAACARTFAHHQKYSSKMISTNCPIVAITEVCYFWWFRVESAVGGTCYGVRATLLVGLVTDEKALYTGSTWGQAVGAGCQSWISYCSVRPAEETSDVAHYRTTHVCDWKSRTILPHA